MVLCKSGSRFWKKQHSHKTFVSSLLLSWKIWQTAKLRILKTENAIAVCIIILSMCACHSSDSQITLQITKLKKAVFLCVFYGTWLIKCKNHILAKWNWPLLNVSFLPSSCPSSSPSSPPFSFLSNSYWFQISDKVWE